MVQIDHVVPLGLAWQLGAPQWTLGKRVAFANDPEELLAVNGAVNQAKGDSGPDSWLPPGPLLSLHLRHPLHPHRLHLRPADHPVDA